MGKYIAKGGNNAISQNEESMPAGRPVAKHMLQMVPAGLIIGLLLFGAAGRLDWVLGWIFMLIWFITKLGSTWIVGRADPELIAERAASHEDTQKWDKIVVNFYMLFGFGVFLVSGLDAGRFGWSAMPLWIAAAAILVHLSLQPAIVWVMLTNTYLSREARLQDDREQQVVSSGPYRYVRHPLYVLSILLWLTTPLMLGSWWGLIPAILAGAAMVVRTALEDNMLHRGLKGYAEYAGRVRYRLLPGVW